MLELFKMEDGRPVAGVKAWEEERRPEILRLFSRLVYGTRPFGAYETSFSVEKTDEAFLKGNAVFKKVSVRLTVGRETFQFPIFLFYPSHPAGKIPYFVYPMLKGQCALYDLETTPDTPILPIPEIIRRGYGLCVYRVTDLADDCPSNRSTGIFAKGFSTCREADGWGTIAAWAFGGILCCDYLQQDSLADRERIGIAGHSRGGKTALWAGAQDRRFSFVASNCSGCTGAAYTRGKEGETVQDINSRFPHWFCGNYKEFNGREEEMPFDQHMLLSLIAPRLLYVASASKDTWADPQAEQKSCRLADAAYRLYEKPGFQCPDTPALDTPYHGGRIGYHQRTGDHAITPFDWAMFLDFRDFWEKGGR